MKLSFQSYLFSKINYKNILISPDKFKYSIPSHQVSECIKLNLPKNISSQSIQLADGGQGSLDALSRMVKGFWVRCRVNDPLFRPIDVEYYQTQKDAYIEMARASGLQILKSQQRNRQETTTLGTGQLILKALEKGKRNIHLFVGGSATEDGGIGAASALKYQFYDKNNQLLKPIGGNLANLVKFENKNEQMKRLIKETKFTVYTDVQNPFYGKDGASYVYGTQKGANDKTTHQLDKGMKNLDELIIRNYGIDLNNVPGSGAAGGLAGGCVAFFDAKIKSGIKAMLQITNFQEKARNADLIITGQGKFDSQTMSGKVVKGVVEIARKYDKPVLILCAISEIDEAQVKKLYNKAELRILLNDEEKNIIDPAVTRKKLQKTIQDYFN